MNFSDFVESIKNHAPPNGLSAPLAALWWDLKGDWTTAHGHVDDLSSKDAMAVHAYLHRKEGSLANADYWYARAGRECHRSSLEEEWRALVSKLL